MSSIISIRDFTHGEASPIYSSRSDLVVYNKSALRIENFIVQPGGSLRSRFGTSLITALGSATSFQMFPWKTGVYEYLVILNNNSSIIVYKLSDMTSTILSHSFNASVVTRTVRSAQRQNECVLAAVESAPITLTSNPTTGAVTVATMTFSTPPTFEFDNKYQYGTVFTLNTVKVTPPNTAIASMPILTIQTMGTFGGFTADYVGGQFKSMGPTTGDQIGTARIMQYISSTQVRVRIDNEFAAIDPPPATGDLGSYNGDKSFINEQAYTATKGWPRSITFYQNRFAVAGGSNTPQSIFLSVTGDYDNFDLGVGNDSDSIQFNIDGESNEIQNMISSKSLQIFTNTGEFSSPIWTSGPITPKNVDIRMQTSYGSLNVTPVTLDNQTLYAKIGGKAVMSFYYAEGSTSYDSENISFYSSHLIKNPIVMNAFTENNVYDSNMLFMINDDGEMVFYESLSKQNVSAWCKSTTHTGDTWLNVCSVRSRVFFIVKRGSNYILEEMNWDIVMDSGIKKTIASTGSQTVALGSTYASRDIVIVTDVGVDETTPTGTYIDTITADASGNIVVNLPKTGDYWFGYGFIQSLETMPMHLITQNGDDRYLKKKVTKLYTEYYNSYSFSIEGIQIPMQNLSTSTSSGIILGDPITPKSGVFETTVNTGYNSTITISCEQNLPLPVNILSIAVQLT